MAPEVIVNAIWAGRTVPTELDPDIYCFSRGEHGILKWRRHQLDERLFQPMAVWDGDPSHRPRAINLAEVEVVGLETRSNIMRVYVSSR